MSHRAGPRIHPLGPCLFPPGLIREPVNRPVGAPPTAVLRILNYLAIDAYRKGTAEAEVVDIQVDELLGSHAGIVQKTKQRIVPLAQQSSAIDLSEHALDFGTFQILWYAVSPALELNSKDGLALQQMTWICEREKMLLHIFRAESGAMSKAPRNRPEKRKSRVRSQDGSEDLNGRRRASLRDVDGGGLSRRRYSCAGEASAGLTGSGASQTLTMPFVLVLVVLVPELG
jgi:hypothetical protein